MVAEPVAGCRPLRADAVRNRERILEAARAVFAERGLEATMDDVARCAGVGVGTVYRRFPDKEALVEALFEQSVHGMVELAYQAATIPDAWDGLVWFMEKASQRQAEDLGLRDVMMHGMYGRERITQARERIVPVVAQLVERAQREGRLRPDVVTADIPVIELMVNAVATTTNQMDPELWRRYLKIILDGLSAQGTEHSELPPAPTLETVTGALICHKTGRLPEPVLPLG